MEIKDDEYYKEKLLVLGLKYIGIQDGIDKNLVLYNELGGSTKAVDVVIFDYWIKEQYAKL